MSNNKTNKQNYSALMDTIRTTMKKDCNIVTFNDAENTSFLVDLSTGKIYKQSDDYDDEFIQCYDSSTSHKKNGYLYVTVAVTLEDDTIKHINTAQHIVVLMCGTGYYIPGMVCNHKDNIPFHNQLSNLEWCTQEWNNVHGAVCNAIQQLSNVNYEVMLSEYVRRVVYSNSNISFAGLSVGLSISDLKRFENTLRCIRRDDKLTLKKYWSVSKGHYDISAFDLEQLYKFLNGKSLNY